MQRYLLILICLIQHFRGDAQQLAPQVISSAGGYSSINTCSVAWTIGEPISDTYSANNILTQGFHQPQNVILNSIKDQSADGNIYAYPTPVPDNLTLDFSNLPGGKYVLHVFDASGKLVEDRVIHMQANFYKEKIDMINYSNGIYLFEITNTEKSFTKLFRITKQQ